MRNTGDGFDLKELVPNLPDLVDNFARTAKVTSGIVNVPPPEREKAVTEKYLECLGNTPSPSSLPSEFKSVEIEMDRITDMLPVCHSFCRLIRKSDVGNLRCWWCDLSHCREAFQTRKPIKYKCHMGLTDIVAPIRVVGRHLANAYAGQVLMEDDEDSEDLLRQQYENLELDKNNVSFMEFKEARDKLPRLDQEHLNVTEALLADLAALISERARAHATLMALASVGGDIAPALGRKQGLFSFLRHIGSVLECDSAGVWLTDNDTKVSKPEAMWVEGKSDSDLAEYYATRIPKDGGIIGEVIRKEKHVLLSTREEVTGTPAYSKELREARRLQSFLGVPMWVSDTLIGIFEVGSSVSGSLTSSDVPLLKAFAAHAAAFIQSTYATEVLTEILNESSIKTLVDKTVERVPRLISGKGCSLFLRQKPGKGSAYLVASQGLDRDLVVDNLEEFLGGILSPEMERKASYPPGFGLTGWVLANGRKVVLNLHRSAADRRTAVAELKGRGFSNLIWESKFCEKTDEQPDLTQPAEDSFARKAWIGVPLVTEGTEVFGVLRVSERINGNFTPEEERILEACAKQISNALAKWYSEIGFRKFMMEVVGALAAAIDAKDPYTENHSQVVREIAVAMGREMKLEKALLDQLEIAALLHDVGKIGIPDIILSKPGLLNAAEESAMQMHPELGEEILPDITEMNIIKKAILQHHERLNGEGYPQGLKESEINILAKIIAVADTYSAITSDRPYRKRKHGDFAYREIDRLADKELDRGAVEAFKKLYNEKRLPQVKPRPRRKRRWPRASSQNE